MTHQLQRIDGVKQRDDVAKKFARQDPVEYPQMDLKLDRGSDAKSGPVNVGELRRHGRGIPHSELDKMTEAIESMIGNRLRGLKVLVEGDRVTVTATVPSYYVRQLVEHKSRSIIVDQWRKTFVSRVDVK